MTMSMSENANKHFLYEGNQLIIDKETDLVAYNDEKHVYVGKTGEVEGQKFISVTTLVGMYENKFDGEFWKKYKALELLLGEEEFSKYKSSLLETKKWDDRYLEDIDKVLFEETCQKFLDQWALDNKMGCDRGTKIHAEQEEGFYNIPEVMRKKFEIGGNLPVQKNYHRLDVDSGIFPEILLSFVDKDNVLRIAGQSDLVIKEGNKIKVWDFKGLALDTPIATIDGWKQMGDIVEGDIIFDGDGNQTKVQHVSEIHYNPCYKITFDTGDTLIGDHEHRWVISKNTQKKGETKEVELTTDEIYSYYCKKETNKKIRPLHIKCSGALNIQEVDLPVDPYILGLWLGDGSSQCAAITNATSEVWKEIIERGFNLGVDFARNRENYNAETRTLLNFRKYLVQLDLLNNKHIPETYLRASYSQRLDLLRGLMDSDGYFHRDRQRCVMNTTKEWQAQGIAELVASLGWKPTIIDAVASCNGKKFKSYQVCFKAFENPFLVRNLDYIDCLTKNDFKAKYRTIKKIEKIDTVPTKCLAVDSPTHTYLAGKSLIKTHNTNKKLDLKSYYDPKKKKYQMMKFPLSHIQDCNYMHYTLQLSIYAYMIQRMNPEFIIDELRIIHFTHEGDVKEYTLEYLRDDVERLLKYHKKQILIQAHKDARRPVIY
nr:MAG TPA: Exonuclease V [Caudoviricetes sp.]